MKITGRILILPFFLLTFGTTFGQRLKGNIRSYTDTYYSIREKFGKIQRGPKLNDSIYHDQVVTLDDLGNVTQVVEYNSDGSVHCRYKGKYDYADNNIESIYVRPDPETLVEKKPFIVESVKYSWGEKYQMSYENDPEGRPVEETIYDLFGRELYKIKIKRDEKGHPVEDDISDGSVDLYKYDDKGNLTEWTFRSSNSNVIVTTYNYDQTGNVVEMTINNYFKSTYKFQYDHHTYTYRYDEHGNWTERIDYENDIPKRIVERKIDYATYE